MTNIVFYNQDINDVLRYYQNYFQFIFDDPPYNLESVIKRFGGDNPAAAKGDVHYRSSKGFMQQQWDTDISFDPRMWGASRRAIAPGGYVVSFGGTRTAHKLATAAENAGLDILDYIEYIYGSGFPKPQNVHLDIAKALGYDFADAFDGFRGSTAFKPSHEPLYVMRRPYEDVTSEELFAATGKTHWDSRIILGVNESTHGFDKALIKRQSDAAREFLKKRKSLWKNHGLILPAGLVGEYVSVSRRALAPGNNSIKAVNIGQTEITYARQPYKPWKTNGVAPGLIVRNTGGVNVDILRNGRGNWPANTVFQHSPLCVVTPDETLCDDSCMMKKFDGDGGNPELFWGSTYDYEIAEIMLNYINKPTRGEKDAGLGDLPYRGKQRLNRGGLSNDPRWATVPAKNHHPTVKSIDFCRKIGSAFLPPAEHPRRALVRFGGTGAEVIGLILAADRNGVGWDEIVVAETEREYFDILVPRVNWWLRQRELGLTSVAEGVALWHSELKGLAGEKRGQYRQMSLLEAE